MTDNYIISSQPDGGLEVIINALEGEEGFEHLINYLTSILGVEMLDLKYEEHNVRKCLLKYNGVIFEASYDTLFGNCIIAKTPESRDVVLLIANKLNDWL